MSTPLRVLACAHDPEGPSARYRVTQFIPAAAAAGIECRVLAVPRATKDRREWFAALPAHDLVVWSRTLLGAGEVRWLRRAATRLCYDVDDALPYRTPEQGGGRSSRRTARFRRLCAAAHLVVAGNRWIAELAGADARAVRTVPTPVDPTRYLLPATGDGRTLVWIGQPATAPYLGMLAAPLARVADAVPGLRLRCIGGHHPALEQVAGLTVETVEWSPGTEAAELAQADVGLAPLEDDPWSRGKCGLRLLQYCAAGLAAVASPVGTQAELIDEGAALSATAAAQWATSLTELLREPERRRALAQTARRVCEERYSTAVVAPLVIEAWRAAAAGDHTPTGTT